MSFLIFSIDQKDVNISREPRVHHMIEYVKEPKEPIIITFVDTGLDTFQAKELKHEEEVQPAPIDREVLCTPQDNALWTIYFDGACSMEGSGVGDILISP